MTSMAAEDARCLPRMLPSSPSLTVLVAVTFLTESADSKGVVIFGSGKGRNTDYVPEDPTPKSRRPLSPGEYHLLIILLSIVFALLGLVLFYKLLCRRRETHIRHRQDFYIRVWQTTSAWSAAAAAVAISSNRTQTETAAPQPDMSRNTSGYGSFAGSDAAEKPVEGGSGCSGGGGIAAGVLLQPANAPGASLRTRHSLSDYPPKAPDSLAAPAANTRRYSETTSPLHRHRTGAEEPAANSRRPSAAPVLDTGQLPDNAVNQTPENQQTPDSSGARNAENTYEQKQQENPISPTSKDTLQPSGGKEIVWVRMEDSPENQAPAPPPSPKPKITSFTV